MQRNFILLILFLFTTFSFAQTVQFIDAVFESYCLNNFDTNLNGSVEVSEVNIVQNLTLSNINVHSLEGLQEFKNLKSLTLLDLPFSPSFVLNLSNQSELTHLVIERCYLRNLDLPTNSSLKKIYSEVNFINTLDVSNQLLLEELTVLGTLGPNTASLRLNQINLSNNINLKRLNLNRCILSTIDLSQNHYLEYLNLGKNIQLQTIIWSSSYINLKEVYVNGNLLSGAFPSFIMPNIEILRIQTNNISSINLSNNLNLYQFTAAGNNLTTVDVTQNTNLKYLKLYGNNLSELILNNNQIYEAVDVRNNNFNDLSAKAIIGKFQAENNPMLQCIEVLDPVAALSNTGYYWNWTKDSNVDYAINCDLTYIPDDAFEQWVINNTAETGPIDDWVETSNLLSITNYSQSFSQVQDFTGIEDFINLEIFYISTFSNSNLSLDLEQNSALKDVSVLNFNQISNFVLPNPINSSLEKLQMSFTNLSSLYLNGYNNLQELKLNDNVALSSVTIQNNQNLKYVLLEDSPNLITQINNNPNIEIFNAQNVGLNQFDGSLYPNLKELRLKQNSIDRLNLSNNTDLNLVAVEDNTLEVVSVKNGNNAQLTYLALTNCPNLVCINVDDPQLAVAGQNLPYSNWQKDATASYSNQCFTYMPDDAFEQWVINNTSETGPIDDWVLTSNLLSITNYSQSFSQVLDFTGIEDFINLETFYISTFSNSNLSLDLEQNSALKDVSVLNFNQISNFVLPNPINSSLEKLQMSFTNLSSLDLNGYNNLQELKLNDNVALSSVAIQNNQNLEYVFLEDSPNLITQINNNPNIKIFNAQNVGLNQFDGSLYPNLQELWLKGNSIDRVNLSTNLDLNLVVIEDSTVEVVSLKNGNNLQLTYLDLTNCPNLVCINVDDPQLASSVQNLPYSNWQKDSTAYFSNQCLTYIPDDAFEQWVITNTSEIGPIDDWVFTSNIENITALYLNNTGVQDITGLQDFASLEELKFKSESNLTSLNLGDFDNLKEFQILNCTNVNNLKLPDPTVSQLRKINIADLGITVLNIDGYNYLRNVKIKDMLNLTSLNVINNQNLKYMTSKNAQSSNIIYSNNPNTINLSLVKMGLTTFDVSSFADLKKLSLNKNSLLSLDISNNTNLEELTCTKNELENLNLKNGNNSSMSKMYAQNNPNLYCIKVDDPNITNYSNWNVDSQTSYDDFCLPYIELDSDQSVCDKTCIELTDYILFQESFCQNSSVEFYNITNPQNPVLIPNTNFEITSNSIFQAVINDTCTGLSHSATIAFNISNSTYCSNNAPIPCSNSNSMARETVFDIEIFPNPNNGDFTIKNLKSIKADFTIKDLRGQVYFKSTVLNNSSIDVRLRNYQSGIYYVQVIYEDDSETIIKKIVIK